MISNLPNDVLNLILLDTNNINCKFTCKRWNYILLGFHIITMWVQKCYHKKDNINFKPKFLNPNYLNLGFKGLMYDKHELKFETKLFKLTRPIIVNEQKMNIKIPLEDFTCNNLKGIFHTIDKKMITIEKIRSLKYDKNYTYNPIIKKISCEETSSIYEYFESTLLNDQDADEYDDSCDDYGDYIRANIYPTNIIIKNTKWEKTDEKTVASIRKQPCINDINGFMPIDSTIRLIIEFKYETNNLISNLKINIKCIECTPPLNYVNKNINFNKPNVLPK